MTAEGGRPFCLACGVSAEAVVEMIYCDLWECWLCTQCCEASDDDTYCAFVPGQPGEDTDPHECCYRNGACEA